MILAFMSSDIELILPVYIFTLTVFCIKYVGLYNYVTRSYIIAIIRTFIVSFVLSTRSNWTRFVYYVGKVEMESNFIESNSQVLS